MHFSQYWIAAIKSVKLKGQIKNKNIVGFQARNVSWTENLINFINVY